MSALELIKHVGSENVSIQWLSQAMTAACQSKRGTLLTFGTTQISALELATNPRPDWVALIVWMPRSKLPESIREKV